MALVLPVPQSRPGMLQPYQHKLVRCDFPVIFEGRSRLQV